MVPDRPLIEQSIITPKFLDEGLLTTPSLALDLVRCEIRHMGELVRDMLSAIMLAIIGGNASMLEQIQRKDEYVDTLHAQIVVYLGKISGQQLTDKQSHELLQLMNVAEEDADAAKAVREMKKKIRGIANSAALHEAKRLVADEPHRIEAYTIEMDITEKLQRIYYFARRVARTVKSKGSKRVRSDREKQPMTALSH